MINIKTVSVQGSSIKTNTLLFKRVIWVWIRVFHSLGGIMFIRNLHFLWRWGKGHSWNCQKVIWESVVRHTLNVSAYTHPNSWRALCSSKILKSVIKKIGWEYKTDSTCFHSSVYISEFWINWSPSIDHLGGPVNASL